MSTDKNWLCTFVFCIKAILKYKPREGKRHVAQEASPTLHKLPHFLGHSSHSQVDHGSNNTYFPPAWLQATTTMSGPGLLQSAALSTICFVGIILIVLSSSYYPVFPPLNTITLQLQVLFFFPWWINKLKRAQWNIWILPTMPPNMYHFLWLKFVMIDHYRNRWYNCQVSRAWKCNTMVAVAYMSYDWWKAPQINLSLLIWRSLWFESWYCHFVWFISFIWHHVKNM